MEDCCGTCC